MALTGMMQDASSDTSNQLKIFISYSRSDMMMVDSIVAALEARGFEVLIDRRDLPYGEEWQAELADLIRKSDTIVWLVSPASVASRWCNWEVGEVQRRSKRVLPVLIARVEPEQLPEALGRIHFLPASGCFDLGTHLEVLVQTLYADQVWLRKHTNLGLRARDWLKSDRNPALLLRGMALNDAEAWADQKPPKAPPPSERILEFILTSRRAQGRRQRIGVAASVMVAFTGISLAAFAFLQWGEAVDQQRVAQMERDGALRSQSRFLAEQARLRNENGDYGTAIALALEAMPDETYAVERPLIAEAERELFRATSSLLERQVLAGSHDELIAVSTSGRVTLAASPGNSAKLWDAASGKTIAVLGDHQYYIRSAAFSPDDRKVATASEERAHVNWSPATVQVWDIASGAETAVLRGHDGWVGPITFSRDGSRVLAATGTDRADPKTMLWDAETGAVIAVFPVGSENLSIEGDRVLTVSINGIAQLWDAETGYAVSTLDGHEGKVNKAAFSSSGDMIVTAGDDGTARLWDIEGAEIAVLEGHQDAILFASFAPEGLGLATVSRDGTARHWNAGSLELISVVHQMGILDSSFSPNGERLVTRSADGTAKVWDVRTGTEIATLRGHENIETVAFTADGQSLVTALAGGTAHTWLTETPPREAVVLSAHVDEPLAHLDEMITIAHGDESPVLRNTFSTDRRKAMIWYENGSMRLWDVAGREELALLRGYNGWEGFRHATFSRDGRRVIVLVMTRMRDEQGRLTHIPTVRLWDTETGALFESLSDETLEVRFADFSPDGSQIVTMSKGGAVGLWDAETGSKIAVFPDQDEVIYPQVSPDGRRLLTGVSSARARLWDLETNSEIAILDRVGKGGVAYLAFSPEGTRALTIGQALDTITVWNSDSGTEISAFDGYEPTFSPDGKRLVVLSGWEAEVWDTENGARLAILEGHQDFISSAAFSHDGRQIITADDSTVRIWDTENGTEIANFRDDGHHLRSAEFSSDSTQVITTSEDGSRRFWTFFPTTQVLVDHGRAIVPRCLTPKQRDEVYLLPEPPTWCIDLVKWPFHSQE